MSAWVAVVAATAVAVLAAASAAGAAPTQPLTLGTGSNPLVAVDATGTAHFVWNRQVGEGRDIAYAVEYCRIRRIPLGAAGCEAKQTLGAGLASAFAFDLLLRPSETGGTDVIVLANGGETDMFGGSYSIVSSDGGAWSVSHVSTRGANDAQLAADRNYVELLSGGWFVQAPLTGPASDKGFDVRSGTGFAGAQLGRIARTGATIMTGTARGTPGSRNSGSGAIRFLTGTVAGAGNDEAAWTAWRARPATFLSWLATGPGGAYVLAESASRFCALRTLAIRRFAGTQLDPPSQISYYRGICEGVWPGPLRFSHLTQDLAGRLQSAWLSYRDGCLGKRCIIYRRATAAGRPLGQKTTLRASRGFAYNLRVAGGRDPSHAWVVWQEGSGGDEPIVAQHAFVSSEAAAGDGTVRLQMPPECVRPGKRFYAKLVPDGVRAAAVRFTVSRERAGLRPRRRRDTRAPFKVRIRVPREHALRTVRITARVKPRGGGDAVKVYQDVSYGC